MTCILYSKSSRSHVKQHYDSCVPSSRCNIPHTHVFLSWIFTSAKTELWLADLIAVVSLAAVHEPPLRTHLYNNNNDNDYSLTHSFIHSVIHLVIHSFIERLTELKFDVPLYTQVTGHIRRSSQLLQLMCKKQKRRRRTAVNWAFIVHSCISSVHTVYSEITQSPSMFNKQQGH